MKEYRYIRTAAGTILFLLIFSASSWATWTKIAQLAEPISCVFFSDPNHGFAGTGSQSNELTLQIWMTTNGGTTWSQSSVPPGDGRVTQIVIRPDGIGFASIFSKNNPKNNFWKTTDGGYNWVNISSNNYWYGTGAGPNGEFAYWYDSTTALNTTVLTGTNGVFTMAGGNTLINPGPNRPGFGEAWGAFGDSIRNTWYMTTDQSRLLYVSTDGGNTWGKSARFNFGSMMTGGFVCSITGTSNTLYVQTERDGIFRGSMSDTGASWVRIGGPSNDYDTRTMYISGCAGQNILAFDNNGNLYESNDGGNGGLSIKSDIAITHAKFLSISSCHNLTKKATFVMTGCRPYIITNYSLLNNTSGVYTILGATKTPHLTTPIPLTIPDTLQAGDSVVFTINFNPHFQVGAYNSVLRILGYYEAGFGAGQLEADSNIQVTGASQAEPPKAQANLTEIDFGHMSICGAGSDSIIIMKNIGCDTLQITSEPGTLDSAFVIDSIILPFTIPPDSMIVIHVHFKPKHSGYVESLLNYQISAQGINNSIQFSIHGNGDSDVFTGFDNFNKLATQDTISFCSPPDSIDVFFGFNACEKASTILQDTTHTGSKDFWITGIYPGMTINSGDTIHCMIHFKPQSKGVFSVSYGLTFNSTLEFDGFTIRKYVKDGTKILSASLSTIDFGATSLCNNPPDSSIIFYNKGCDTLEITEAQMSGSGFKVTGVTFPILILPGSSGIITIHPFLDTTNGKTVMSGSLNIKSDADNSTNILPVTFTRSITPHRNVGMYLDAATKRGTDQNVVTFDIKETPGKSFTGSGVKQITFDLAHNADLLEFIPGQSSGNGISGTPDGSSFTLSNNSEITADANGVLATLAFRVYLTKDSTTSLTLDTVAIGGGSGTTGDCATTLSYSGSATFGYDFACGERSIQSGMNGIVPIDIISIRPNPAQDELKLRYFSSSDQEVTIAILDALGKSYKSYSSHASYGTNTESIDTKNLSQGVYQLRIGSVSQSFIKVK